MKGDRFGCCVNLTESEHCVNHSKLWTYSKVAMNAVSPVYFLHKTGEKYVKIVMRINSNVAIKVTILENPSISLNGTEVLARGNGLNSPPQLFKAYYAPSFTSEGDEKIELYAGGSYLFITAGAGIDGRAPLLLNKNSEQLIKCQFTVTPATINYLAEVVEELN